MAERKSAIESCRQQLKTVCRLVLADEIPERVDVLFIHARAVGMIIDGNEQLERPGNDEGTLFTEIAKLYKLGMFSNLLLPGNDGQNWNPDDSIEARYAKGRDKRMAWAGRSEYTRQIADVSDIPIENTYYTGANIGHTRDENKAVAEEIEVHRWKSLALLAHPHQLLRAISGQIKEAEMRGSNEKIYVVHPPITDWKESVASSQGQNTMPRKNHALPEMRRVVTYAAEVGNLANPDEILEYFKWRDGDELQRLMQLHEKKIESTSFRKDVVVMDDASDALTIEELERLTNHLN